MELATIQGILNGNGFPCGPADGDLGPRTKAAVAYFQRAHAAVYPWLQVDGIPGPRTQGALERLPHLSDHFTVGELACRHCRRCYVRRELLQALETLRAHLGHPLRVIDAYRCPGHNAEVGGAPNSMHLEGFAADLPPVTEWERVWALRLFSGLGDRRGMIAHVDLRHLSDANQTRDATPERPARWTYR